MKCLEETQAEKISTYFAKQGMLIAKLENAKCNNIQIPSCWKSALPIRARSNYTALGRKIFKFFNEELNKTDKKAIHIELTWTYGNEKHSMALIIFKNKFIEYFDPSGYCHVKPRMATYPADKVMYYVIQGIILEAPKGFKFFNINTKNINPTNHCNSWSLLYHYLRYKLYENANINNITKIKAVVNIWQQYIGPKTQGTNNKQRNARADKIIKAFHLSVSTGSPELESGPFQELIDFLLKTSNKHLKSVNYLSHINSNSRKRGPTTETTTETTKKPRTNSQQNMTPAMTHEHPAQNNLNNLVVNNGKLVVNNGRNINNNNGRNINNNNGNEGTLINNKVIITNSGIQTCAANATAAENKCNATKINSNMSKKEEFSILNCLYKLKYKIYNLVSTPIQ